MTRDGDLDTIAEGVAARDARSLARALTWVENGDSRAAELEARLQKPERPAVRIGLTGPPGVGKSSLISALIPKLNESGRVAVLAIDPTSPISGGALLGDRVRMRGLDTDGVFIRSLATRRGSGGVAQSSLEAADLLERAGFDMILMETVGVGQLEIEIVEEADIVLLLLSPESGDVVQLLKGGLMEVVDRVVVNKIDRPGADKLIQVASELAHDRGDAEPIGVSATNGDGLDELVVAIQASCEAIRTGCQKERAERRIRRRLARHAEQCWIASHWQAAGGQSALEALAEDIHEGRATFHEAVRKLVEE